jgi:hypothetical protein
MPEHIFNPFEIRSEKLWEGQPIASPFDTESFRMALQKKSFNILESHFDGSDHSTRVKIDPGWYYIELGFPEIDSNDQRYLYSNLPPDLQERPLELDVSHESFRLLAEKLGETINGSTNFSENLDKVKRLIEDNFEPNSKDEHVRRLSEIIMSKKSACSGLSLIAGLLCKEVFSELTHVQTIHGASAKFENQRSHDIGHMWLRISNGKDVALYDPYYGQMRIYDLRHFLSDPSDPFRGFELQADGGAQLQNEANMSLFKKNVRVVRSIRGSLETWYDKSQSMTAQLTGKVGYEFETKVGGTLNFVNNGIEISKNRNLKDSSRYIDLLYDLQKIS